MQGSSAGGELPDHKGHDGSDADELGDEEFEHKGEEGGLAGERGRRMSGRTAARDCTNSTESDRTTQSPREAGGEEEDPRGIEWEWAWEWGRGSRDPL
eukprot:750633-Hanusia_phi.AAC.2